MDYNFTEIERKWKQYWIDEKVYKVNTPSAGEKGKQKLYILDMFPYPSGAGLHVGHPLGYIASDIYARYKRLCGYNVLHPMGFDEFGLPAEQYALETGQHPAVTTQKNIARYREQLDNIGISYDWDRQVHTSEAKYYKWTQWIFLQLFHSWYDRNADTTKPIKELVAIFEKEGNVNHCCPVDDSVHFGAAHWADLSEKEKRDVLMKYRIAYQGYAQVWWCEALGTVLANDEVVNGVSERGGFPVERKNMRQWFLRITEYADRLLQSLETLDWTDAMKEMQRNWIGKSNGAEVRFSLTPALSIGEGETSLTPTLYKGEGGVISDVEKALSRGEGLGEAKEEAITVFTTRPDTIFGVDFMVLAPEHELVDAITTAEQRTAIEEYKTYVKSRSERERMSEVKQITGCFTGAYAMHPLTQKELPVWISEYVLAGYGTGAIMAVPSGDDRDHAFAQHFNIPITNVFGEKYTGEKAYSGKTGTIENSGFLTGMPVPEAIDAAIDALVKAGVGKKKVNFRLRDAGFSRQRYWGEPFPIVYQDDVPYAIDEPEILGKNAADILPVELPMVEHYKPGPEGQGPLANVTDWVNTPDGQRETNTMPGYAGSSWYFLRYMDPQNEHEFASRAATDYWNQVDLYIGGTEHAVGHLLYSRMWTKALCDLGYIGFDEPFKKLLNQGMIQGSSRFAYYLVMGVPKQPVFSNPPEVPNAFVSKDIIDELKKGDGKVKNMLVAFVEEVGGVLGELSNAEEVINGLPFRKTHVKVDIVDGLELDIDAFRNSRKDAEYAKYFVNEDGKFICSAEIEKMSKSKYNVVNPDDIIAQYGADTFRMYEMFLGPIEMSKPWDTKGIEGVHRFLKKLWRLYAGDSGLIINSDAPTDAEWRVLHKTIKKISEDMERFSFNTSVSQFMIAVNDLGAADCHKRAILEPLAILICPFAPHIAEELWHMLGNTTSVVLASFPKLENRYLTENSKRYPIAINGKPRVEMEFALDAEQAEIEQAVLANEIIQKWLEGNSPKKFIYVKGKMINVVI